MRAIEWFLITIVVWVWRVTIILGRVLFGPFTLDPRYEPIEKNSLPVLFGMTFNFIACSAASVFVVLYQFDLDPVSFLVICMMILFVYFIMRTVLLSVLETLLWMETGARL